MNAIELTVRDLHNTSKFHTYRFFYNDKNTIKECQYCQTIGTEELGDITEECYSSDWRDLNLASPIYPKYFEQTLDLINNGLKNPLSL